MNAITEKKINRYYQKGLNSKEIGKLLDISPRTVQRYINDCEIKNQTTPKTQQQKAFELSAAGFSYAQIAKRLKIAKTTVYLWHKKQKELEQ